MLGKVDGLLAAVPVDRTELAQLKMSLAEKLETLKQLDAAILEHTDDANLEEEITRTDEFKANIYSAMAKLDLASSATPPAAATAAGTDTAPTPAATTPAADSIKLPKLTIDPFDGELTKWTPFWDSFESAIHGNGRLSAADKFNYLRSLLKGTAREAVSGLMLTAANYAEAVSILKKRFGNKQQIISRHMDLLMNVESVASHNNVKALRRMYDAIETNVRSLKALGVTSDSYGGLLSSVVMNKLPAELRLILTRKVEDDDWQLDVIMEQLLKEIEARE